MNRITNFIIFSAFSIFAASSAAMEIPQPSDSQARLLEKLVGYQGLLQAEKDHTERSLNFIAKYQIGDKIPESELDIQENIEAYAALYRGIPLASLANKKQTIIVFLEILQYDLVFTTYVDKFLSDLITTLGNNQVKIEDDIFQSHITEFSKHLACHNQFTSNDIAANILGLLTLEDKLKSDFANFIPPRNYFLNDGNWSKVNLNETHFPELEHQKQNLFLFSQLEDDLNTVMGKPSLNPDSNISNNELNRIFGKAFISFCGSKSKVCLSILSEEVKEITRSSSKATPTTNRLRQKLFSQKTFADYILASQEIDDFLNKYYRPLSSKLATPVFEQKKRNASKKKAQIKKKQIITTPKSITVNAPVLKEEVKAIIDLDVVPTEITIPALTPVVIEQEQESEEEFDYYKWFSQQRFADKKTITNSLISEQTQERVPTMPELSATGQEFFDAVFGLGGKNVTVKHFNSFLKDIGGFKMKMTRNGLKIVDHGDTSVELFYSVPNLGLSKNGTGKLIYKIHQPHAGNEFARRTLYEFLRPQLEAAGYSPR